MASVTITEKGKQICEEAKIRQQITGENIMVARSLVARGTVRNFFQGKPVRMDSALQICKALEVAFEKVVLEEKQATLATSSSIRLGTLTHTDRDEKIKAIITIQADISMFDDACKNAMDTAMSHYVEGDIITLNVEPGSVKLTIQGSSTAIRKLLNKINSGEIQELNGYTVLGAELLKEQSSSEKWAFVRKLRGELQIYNNTFLGSLLDSSGNVTLGVFFLMKHQWSHTIRRLMNRLGITIPSRSFYNLYGMDLCDADLSQLNLIQANLTHADLSDADLSHSVLIRANLTSTNLTGASLIGALLQWAKLSNANLSRATLHGANLYSANLSGGNLIQANLSEALLYGADFKRADLRKANLAGTSLALANLSEANLSGAILSEAILHGAFLVHTDLSYANVSNARLTNTKTLSANFSNADLSNARLGGYFFSAIFTNANLSEANLSGGFFNGANLTNANVSAGKLISSDLRSANLRQANFIDAVLTGANLRNASLRETNFTNANLKNANLRNANLDGAKFDNAQVKRCLFGTGIGLTDEQKLDLKSRGGIFDHELQSGFAFP